MVTLVTEIPMSGITKAYFCHQSYLGYQGCHCFLVVKITRMYQKCFALLRLTTLFFFFFFFIFFFVSSSSSSSSASYYYYYYCSGSAGCRIQMREVCVLWPALRCEWSREQDLPEGPVQVSGARRRAQEEEIGAECTRDRNSAGGVFQILLNICYSGKKDRSYINNLQRLSLHFMYYMNLVSQFLTFTLWPVKAMGVQ